MLLTENIILHGVYSVFDTPYYLLLVLCYTGFHPEKNLGGEVGVVSTLPPINR